MHMYFVTAKYNTPTSNKYFISENVNSLNRNILFLQPWYSIPIYDMKITYKLVIIGTHDFLSKLIGRFS